MLDVVSEETYQDGEIIIEEGTSGDWVYIVQEGRVEISKMIGGKKFVMTTLGPGEVFGELSFLGGVERTATVRAIGATSVGVIDRNFLDQEFNKLSSEFRTILVAVVKRFKQMADRTAGFSSRQETRTQKTLSVSYEDKESFVDAYTENLSDGGLFVSTRNPLKQGEQFLLTLQLPDFPDPMKIKCEVVWARAEGEETDSPNGMGVKFIEITQEDKETLKQYLNL
jgi:uncharacterized protein (TIGR02266 family)